MSTFLEEVMSQSFFGRYSISRVQGNQLLQEIKGQRIWLQKRECMHDGLILGIEFKMALKVLPFVKLHNVRTISFTRRSQNVKAVLKHLKVIIQLEYRSQSEQLCENTAS